MVENFDGWIVLPCPFCRGSGVRHGSATSIGTRCKVCRDSGNLFARLRPCHVATTLSSISYPESHDTLGERTFDVFLLLAASGNRSL